MSSRSHCWDRIGVKTVQRAPPPRDCERALAALVDKSVVETLRPDPALVPPHYAGSMRRIYAVGSQPRAYLSDRANLAANRRVMARFTLGPWFARGLVVDGRCDDVLRGGMVSMSTLFDEFASAATVTWASRFGFPYLGAAGSGTGKAPGRSPEGEQRTALKDAATRSLTRWPTRSLTAVRLLRVGKGQVGTEGWSFSRTKGWR